MATLTSNKINQPVLLDGNSTGFNVCEAHKDPYHELRLAIAAMKASAAAAGIIKHKRKHVPKVSSLKRGGQVFLRITPPAPKYRATIFKHQGLRTMRIVAINLHISPDADESKVSASGSEYTSNEENDFDDCESVQGGIDEPSDEQESTGEGEFEQNTFVLPFHIKEHLT